jgi:hypothetical protein
MELDPMYASENAAPSRVESTEIDQRLDFLAAYCAGWAEGDPDMIRAAVADGFVLGDPEDGGVLKDDLDRVLSPPKETVDGRPHGSQAVSYFALSGPVVDSSRSTTKVWCSFAVAGTGIQGISQIRIGDRGVLSSTESTKRSHMSETPEFDAWDSASRAKRTLDVNRQLERLQSRWSPERSSPREVLACPPLHSLSTARRYISLRREKSKQS